MYISEKEQMMYQVMKAINDSGIPICFKGSMVLKACLYEAGYSEALRHTVDIDANWNTDAPLTAEKMVESLQNAIDNAGLSLQVSIYRMYAEKRSAGFMLTDRISGVELFGMDIDVNRPISSKKLYEIAGFSFVGTSPTQIIADKVAAISSDSVFRRIKDVLDIYYISKTFSFCKKDVLNALSESQRTLGDFKGFMNRQEDLKHAYEKFRLGGDIPKPQFDDVYKTVKRFIKTILPKEKKIEYGR